MFQRSVYQKQEPPFTAILPSEDPWKADTTAWSIDDEWAKSVILPDFELVKQEISGDALTDFLPQPLKDNFLLSQGYVRLVELTRQIQAADRISVIQALRKGSTEVGGLHSNFGAAIKLLADILAHCDSKDSELLRRFQKLQTLFQELSAKDRGFFLATLAEVTAACQPLAESSEQ